MRTGSEHLLIRNRRYGGVTVIVPVCLHPYVHYHPAPCCAPVKLPAAGRTSSRRKGKITRYRQSRARAIAHFVTTISSAQRRGLDGEGDGYQSRGTADELLCFCCKDVGICNVLW